MKQIHFVLLGIILILSCRYQAQERAPNILFIAVDDLRPDLGCYGHPLVHSPHLDQLARQGFLFRHHYVQVPTCGASRRAFLKGLRPSKPAHLSNQIIANENISKTEPKAPESFIHHLKRNGYYTVGIGKISHSADGYVYGYTDSVSHQRELPYSWDELHFDAGKWQTGWNAFFAYANGENRQSLQKQVPPYEAAKTPENVYPDQLSTDLALKQLRQLSKQKEPFFLGLGYFKPHLPFNAPKQYWDLYQRNEIALPDCQKIPKDVHLAGLHQSGEFNQYQLGEEKARLDTVLSDAYAKKLKHAYYACISYIDHQIGQVLDQLKTLGLDKNTIVVIWGDHGWHLGDLRMWGKHSLFEQALRSTLIIRLPNSQQGHEIETVVESVDIYPSLMELCKINLPYSMDGESFVDLMNRAAPKTNQYAYSYFKKGISVRSQTFRLTKYYRNEQPQIELYDYRDSDCERENMAPKMPEIVEKMLPLLEKGNTGIYE